MKRRIALLMMCIGIVTLGACQRDRMSEVGFSLPAGDVIAGRNSFIELQCNQCHTIVGEELPPVALADPPYVELGGSTTKVKTYGQLVTAIINPSHDLAAGYAAEEVSENGESRMHNYNDYISVQQLVDIVMFLQPHYEVVIPSFPLGPHL